MNPIFKEGETILETIKKANSILLHCHPSPDPDSVGSVLAMKFALEQLGKKKVTIIAGDSRIPEAFMHFPGAHEILTKNFWEIDIHDYDLFLVLDSSADGISRIKKVDFPLPLTVVNIDHHKTNTGCGSINLIDTRYPANCLILLDLFKQWGIQMTPEIASNLFIGAYTDTGGFKYPGVTPETFENIAELARYIPDIPSLIAQMENSTTYGFLRFQAVALESITVECGGLVGISAVPFSVIESKGLVEEDIQSSRISSFLRTVVGWKIVACAVEATPGVVKVSFRSNDAKTYDLSKLVTALGGGGHPAAAGAVIKLPMKEAFAKIVETIKVIYNL